MNVYWPIYKNIEKEIIDLANHFVVDDEQLKVYSFGIADLIVRCGTEIEALAKELYLSESNATTNIADIKFDFQGISYLERNWLIDKKEVLLSNHNIFLKDKVYLPFLKNEKKGTRSIYGWNNAYQSLKHNKKNDLKEFGTMKYLLEISAALYLLNIYYKNESFLSVDEHGTNIDRALGSALFSLIFDSWHGDYLPLSTLGKKEQEKAAYLITTETENLKEWDQFSQKLIESLTKELLKHPKVKKLGTSQLENLDYVELAEVVGIIEYKKIVSKIMPKKFPQPKWVAVLNKNNKEINRVSR